MPEPKDPALQALLDIGLLVPKGESELQPVDPAVVEAKVGGRLRQDAHLLIERATRITADLAALSVDLDVLRARGKHAIPRIYGKAEISAFVDDHVGRARTELLTAQPGGPRAGRTLNGAQPTMAALLERGGVVRTLYQHTAWHSEITRTFADQVIELGAEVRTLDEFFDRLIIVDREVAFLPGSADRTVALLIEDEALIHFLVDVFDKNWQRAQPFVGTRSPQRSVEISSEVQDLIIRGLEQGSSDDAIARRAGISRRSFAAHLAKLKDEFGVETRFQLGQKLALRNQQRPLGPGKKGRSVKKPAPE